MSVAKYISLSICLFLLGGCASSNGVTHQTEQHPTVDYEFIGVPVLYFGNGTSVPISKELSITAAHVARLGYDTVVAYHPSCDIAIITTDNTPLEIPFVGEVFAGEHVTTFGMDIFGDVLTSQGKYHLDLNFINDSDYTTCPASIMDAPIQAGMSGGGVYNNKNELVGIITAMADKEDTHLLSGEPLDIERLSIFVSMLYLQPWITTTIQNYYQ